MERLVLFNEVTALEASDLENLFLRSARRDGTDGERYESFKEATIIDTYLEKSYRDLNYTLIEVPFDTIKNRSNFILNWLKNNA